MDRIHSGKKNDTNSVMVVNEVAYHSSQQKTLTEK